MIHSSKLLTGIFLVCIINCLAERQPLTTQAEFEKKYDIDLQVKTYTDHGRQGDVYFGKCKKENVIHDVNGNLIEEVVLKVGKPKRNSGSNELQNVTEEVKHHDFLLDGKIDMEFGVVPVFDTVDFVDEKTKRRMLGYVMAKTDTNSIDSLFKKPITLAKLTEIAMAGFRTLKHIGMKGMAHRDLKGDNMARGYGKWSKIIYALDFGRAEIYKPDPSNKNVLLPGHKSSMSLELLRKLHRPGPADDMYTFCEILLELICWESLPWADLSDSDINDIIAFKEKFTSTREIIKAMGKREYILKLLKDENSEKNEEQFYAMFDNCFRHIKQLSTPYQEPRDEWYDDAAKFFV